MNFGSVPLERAEGAILVHSVALPRGKMKKGRVLSRDDIAALRDANIREVTVVRLEPGDMAENDAATAIAEASCGDGVRRQAAFTGRANLFAREQGVAVIDRERVDTLNDIDEAITIATVVPYQAVVEGQMLATVKIIPFSAPEASVHNALAVAAGNNEPLVRVAAFKPHRAGLIMTRLADTRESVLDKTAKVLADRLTALGSDLAEERRCEHRADAIANEIRGLRAAGCDPILIFGASAITDRKDEIPAGIEIAGGIVEHFGMPVDPGNLLLLGRIEERPVIGLPGCARSPKLNGFDWVLQRLLAGLPVRRRDITGMGAGGLLGEIGLRPQPRAGKTSVADTVPRAPRITAVILAAGQSRRMGVANKLLAEVGGRPMVAHAVAAAREAAVDRIVVVTGHEAGQVAAALDATGIEIVHNPDYAEGLSTSLRAGFAALDKTCDGVIVMLGDMPRVSHEHLERLIAAFNPLEGRSICVPTFDGKRGNPVLFSRQYAEEMRQIAGDVGARHLIGLHEDAVAEVPMADDAIFLDVDTPDALDAVRLSG